jgi:hypothetical protein
VLPLRSGDHAIVALFEVNIEEQLVIVAQQTQVPTTTIVDERLTGDRDRQSLFQELPVRDMKELDRQ